MASKWETNDSAREMSRKYNEAVSELNRAALVLLALSDNYVTLIPSGFDIGNDREDAKDGL